MNAAELAETLSRYDPDALALSSVGSHSALDVAFGARAQGLRNVIVTAKGREKTYARYFARNVNPMDRHDDRTV